MKKRLVRLRIMLGILILMGFPGAAMALEGLEHLQAAAQADQAPECMVHEYMREYNEVLRGYSARYPHLTPELEAEAHAKAMQWVRDVWRDAPQPTVARALESEQFKRATATFRTSQQHQYPRVGFVQ